MKNTYLRKITSSSDISEKMKVRNFIISKFKYNRIIGLAGPNIDKYINWCKSRGYKDITIYENSTEVLAYQLPRIKHPITLIFGDINSVDTNQKDTFYDLDYCCTIKSIKDIIPRLKKNYCITLSRRAVGGENTIKEFFTQSKEKIVTKTKLTTSIEHTVFTTAKGNKYIHANYWDTSAMCCIAKIN